MPNDLDAVLAKLEGTEDQRVRLLLSRTGEASLEVLPLELVADVVTLTIDGEPVDVAAALSSGGTLPSRAAPVATASASTQAAIDDKG